MPEGRLVIGTKRYSSWSMRGWLAVHLAGLDVEEVLIPLAGGGATTALKSATPTGMVPYLEHRGARVWESLAICDYCAEIAPKLWPADRAARAHLHAVDHVHRPHGPLPDYMSIQTKEFPWECETCALFDLDCWKKCRAEKA